MVGLKLIFIVFVCAAKYLEQDLFAAPEKIFS
jgi:hypothetical protein